MASTKCMKVRAICAAGTAPVLRNHCDSTLRSHRRLGRWAAAMTSRLPLGTRLPPMAGYINGVLLPVHGRQT